MKAVDVGIEVLAAEETRLAPPRVVALPDHLPHPASVRERGVEARRNSGHGSTAETSQPAEAVALAQAALQSSRQATAVIQSLLAGATAGPTPEDAARTADHIQAESEALRALGQRLVRLAEALHASGEALRPSPERRRTALAENLQCYKAQHLELVQQAAAMLAGDGALSPRHLVAADACDLGQWQAAARETGWAPSPAFQALERTHKAFHRALAGLLFAHQQRRIETATLLLGELQARAAAMADSLEALCVGVLEANDDLGCQ